MKKLFLSGSSSFLGFHLARNFSKDFKVYAGLSRELDSYEGIEGERVKALSDSVEFVQFNLKDHKNIENVIHELQPEFCIHHAGYATNYGGFDYDFPLSMEINVDPLPVLLGALQKVECRGVVITGTGAEYSDKNESHREDEACVPATPYGLSKLVETRRAQQLCKHLGLPLRIARIFNPFGVMESDRKLFPYLVKNLHENKKVDLSPCEQIRNFDHVDQISSIYKFLVEDCEAGGEEIYNASSKNGIVLKDFLVLLCESLDRDPALLNFGAKEMRASEAMICSSSTTKLLTKYKSASTYEEDIKKFVKEISFD